MKHDAHCDSSFALSSLSELSLGRLVRGFVVVGVAVAGSSDGMPGESDGVRYASAGIMGRAQDAAPWDESPGSNLHHKGIGVATLCPRDLTSHDTREATRMPVPPVHSRFRRARPMQSPSTMRVFAGGFMVLFVLLIVGLDGCVDAEVGHCTFWNCGLRFANCCSDTLCCGFRETCGYSKGGGAICVEHSTNTSSLENASDEDPTPVAAEEAGTMNDADVPIADETGVPFTESAGSVDDAATGPDEATPADE